MGAMSNTNSEPNDAQFIERFLDGDGKAFDALVDRYSGRTYQIAYGVLGNREDAEEVVQDVFVRIHKALGKFRGDAEFSTWIYRIAINLARNKYRWNKCRGAFKKLSLDAPVRDEPDAPTMEVADETLKPDETMLFRELEKLRSR